MTSMRFLGRGVLAVALLALGCGDRAEAWTKPVNKPVAAYGLKSSVALIDTGAERALVLTAWADQIMKTQSVPLGRRISASATSPDGGRLFVLSQGDPDRSNADYQPPALTVVESANPGAPRRYELPDALSSLVVDPEGEFLVAYGANGVVTNPNELIFIKPDEPASSTNPRLQIVPSLGGGAPQRFTFTPRLELARASRRLLVIETDRDLVLVDPADSSRPPVTLPLSDNRTSAALISPGGIAVDPGDVARAACLAVRTDTEDSVYLYTFAPVTPVPDLPANDFKINVNTIYVGGAPSDIAFVNTNRGVRLAALVPSPARSAVLVDVGNNHTQSAALSDGYRDMNLVTNLVSGTAGGFDQALLWNGTSLAGGVALWDLGKVPDDSATTINTAESIVTYNLTGAVTDVVDVPGKPLQILATTNGSFYVFDLKQHTSSPLRASSALTLQVSRDGARIWAFQQGTNRLARIDPNGPSAITIPIERQIDQVFEIDRNDSGKGLMVLHGLSANSAGAGGATVFDALAPDVRTSRLYSGLLLEGLLP
jgi:hypothetical protein